MEVWYQLEITAMKIRNREADTHEKIITPLRLLLQL